MSFKGGKTIIKISDKVTACGTRKNGLYHLDMAPLSDIAAVASLQLWHERLGHVKVAGVKRMIKNKDINGLKCSSMAVGGGGCQIVENRVGRCRYLPSHRPLRRALRRAAEGR